MKSITGKLKMLGNSTVFSKKNATVYSIIEIGDTILSNIVIPNGLDNYLRRALNQDGECTLYLWRRRIMGLRLQDQKMYCDEPLGLPWFIFMVPASIITIPVFGMGLIGLYITYKTWRARSRSRELQAMGAIAV